MKEMAENSYSLISNYKADGYSKEMNAVFEFHGCYFHGCPLCHGIDGAMLFLVNDLLICMKQLV